MELFTQISSAPVSKPVDFIGKNKFGEFGATILKYPPDEDGLQTATVQTFEDSDKEVGRIHRTVELVGVNGQFGVFETSIMSATLNRFTQQLLTAGREESGPVVSDIERILKELKKKK